MEDKILNSFFGLAKRTFYITKFPYGSTYLRLLEDFLVIMGTTQGVHFNQYIII